MLAQNVTQPIWFQAQKLKDRITAVQGQAVIGIDPASRVSNSATTCLTCLLRPLHTGFELRTRV